MPSSLAALEKKLNDLATKAAAGDAAAAAQLMEEVPRLRAMAPSDDWPRPAGVLFSVLDALTRASTRMARSLRTLAPPLVEGLIAHGSGLPYGFRPAATLDAAGVELMARALDGGLAAASRAQIEAMGEGNLKNAVGMTLAVDALERLFEYQDKEVAVAAALTALPWSDERLWLLFRILAGGYAGPFERAWVTPVATAALRALAASTVGIQGDGANKLRALLVRQKIVPRSAAKGVTLPRLPRTLPHDVSGALALLEALHLSPREVGARPPACKASVEALVKTLGAELPSELATLLASHAAIGERQFGPPARMRDLVRDLAGMIREHEADDASPVEGRREYDVRAFDPSKCAVPLGTDLNGDLFFLATAATSDAGVAPVMRFHHDESLVTTVEASSLGEYVALLFLRVYARREGLEVPLRRLEDRPRRITRGLVTDR